MRIRIRNNQCTVRIHEGDRQGPIVVLKNGAPLDITPMPGLWLRGTYFQDEEGHYWKHDDSHFVGLVDGMQVRVNKQITS